MGNAFAMMQLKAIFSDLLREYEFELAQPPESYRNDHTKMVVQLEQPCRLRYRRRKSATTAKHTGAETEQARPLPAGACRIKVDLDLCQGHGVCLDEAPEVFDVDMNPDEAKKARLQLLRAGALVAFVLDGECGPVREAHAALKAALVEAGVDKAIDPKLVDDLEEAIRAHEAELRAFIKVS